MDLTTYLKDKLIDHVARNTAYTSPTSVEVALFTTATDDAGGGTEVTGGSYARQTVTFGAPSSGATDNTGVITFTNMPAATVTHFALFEPSAGSMLAHAALDASKTVSAGASLEFAIGDLDLSFD